MKSRGVFRTLLAFDFGVSLDDQWNVVGMEIAEDWGGMFSGPLRDKLNQKGSELYRRLLQELNQRESLFRYKNLTEISPVAKSLLREADSSDCLTPEGRALLRKEARESRLIHLALERFDKLDQERPGRPSRLAGKCVRMFVALDAAKKALRGMNPYFRKK